MKRKFKRYNNGKITIAVYEGDPVPEGFVYGSVPWSEEKKREVAEKRRKTNLLKYGVENPSQARSIKDKKKETFIKNYGVDCPFQSKELREKAKQTNLKKYGTENPSQSDLIKKKKIETCLKNHGVEHPMQSKEIREKSKQTCLNLYGVEYSSKSEEVKNKAKQTNLERYGVENAMQSQEIQNRLKASNLEKYGVTCTLHSEDIAEKTKKTNLEKYGTETYFQSNDFKDKYKQVMLDKYGVENAFQSKEVQNKIKQTNLENLGVEYPMQSQEVLEKSRQTSLQKYGTEYPNQSEIVKQHIVDSNLKRYGTEHPAQSKYILDKTKKTNQERYGVDWTCLTQEVRSNIKNDYKPNRDFENILKSNDIQYEREFPLKHFNYDFRVGNTLIEINPFPTHNALWTPFNIEKGVDKDYHLKKSINAEENGYHCIHIFDWDDIYKIVRMLQKQETVYARKCSVREVSNTETDDFLNKYHLQNTCRGNKVRIGLYFNKELVSLMTFGKPRYNKSCQWELLRYCNSKMVVGGAEKIFNHFVKEHNPESVISYCDSAKFRGNVYQKLGFTLESRGNPSRHWYGAKDGRHITDNLLLQLGFDKLFDENYGKGTSNEELIIKKGYVPIYDCGQAVYLWKRG